MGQNTKNSTFFKQLAIVLYKSTIGLSLILLFISLPSPSEIIIQEAFQNHIPKTKTKPVPSLPYNIQINHNPPKSYQAKSPVGLFMRLWYRSPSGTKCGTRTQRDCHLPSLPFRFPFASPARHPPAPPARALARPRRQCCSAESFVATKSSERGIEAKAEPSSAFGLTGDHKGKPAEVKAKNEKQGVFICQKNMFSWGKNLFLDVFYGVCLMVLGSLDMQRSLGGNLGRFDFHVSGIYASNTFQYFFLACGNQPHSRKTLRCPPFDSPCAGLPQLLPHRARNAFVPSPMNYKFLPKIPTLGASYGNHYKGRIGHVLGCEVRHTWSEVHKAPS